MDFALDRRTRQRHRRPGRPQILARVADPPSACAPIEAERRLASPATLWPKLATAGLLGVPLPEDVGGGGFGIVEPCLVLEQVGRTVAPVPVLQTLVGGAMPIAAVRHGGAAAAATARASPTAR